MKNKFDNMIFNNKKKSILKVFVYLFLLNISNNFSNDGVLAINRPLYFKKVIDDLVLTQTN
jgi:hypothetical protein